MPDITMCSRDNCKFKDECYRVLANPSQYQSYSDFSNSCNEGNDYQMKIECKDKSQIKRLEIQSS